MAVHLLRKAFEVGIARTLNVSGGPRAVCGRERVERRQARFRDARGKPPRHVRGDDRPALRLGHLDERRGSRSRIAATGRERLEKFLFGDDLAREVAVDVRLRVALEHLERERHGDAAAAQAVKDGGFEAMGIGIVVLLADEHDVGLRDVREHALEIGERLLARVIDTLGNIDRRRW